MSFDNIAKDDYGQECQLTFIDVDTGAAADISGYSTSQQMIFTKPSGTAEAKTAAFDITSGTSGIIVYTLESGLVDESGKWKVRGRVTSGTAVLTTEDHEFWVGAGKEPA